MEVLLLLLRKAYEVLCVSWLFHIILVHNSSFQIALKFDMRTLSVDESSNKYLFSKKKLLWIKVYLVFSD